MANTKSITFSSAGQQYVSRANNSSLQPTGNFTIEAWIKTTSSAVQMIFYTGNTTSGGIISGTWLRMNNGTIEFFSNRNTGNAEGTDFEIVATTTTVNDGAWHHIAAVWDGTTLLVYIDTVLDSQKAWAFAPAYGAIVFVQAGAFYDFDNTNRQFFDGKIDDLRLWSTNRSQSDIAINYQRELAGNETNINAYWKFDDSYSDSTSNNNHWTPSGLPMFSTDVPFEDTTTTSTSTTSSSTSTSTTSTSTSSSSSTSTSRTTSTSTTSTSTTSTITTTSTTTTSTSTTSTSSSTTTTSTSTSTTTSTSTSTTITMDLRLIVEKAK